jgi:glycosyltransferase involved in cell wall biosynthesis
MLIDKLTSSRSAKKFNDLVAKADMARDATQWADAARSYDSALKLRPNNSAIWVQYGHAVKESGDHDGAERAYLCAIEIEPLADTYLQLGHLYSLMKRTQLAEENYLKAIQLDNDLKDAKDELVRLGWNAARLGGPETISDQASSSVESALPAGTKIAFELSDLVDFLQNARYPTGIQRVQLELAEALRTAGTEINYVYFDNSDFLFKEISSIKVKQIFDLVSDAARPEALRKSTAERLKIDIRAGSEFIFPQNSVLVNVGASWGYHNYFMVIREMKARYGLLYAPLVHDTIPLLFPQFCDQNLIMDFINWIDGVTEHADILLANSNNTLEDVTSVFSKLQKPMPPSLVLPLNGEFRERGNNDVDEGRKAEALLRLHNLDVENYVLMVSTIEPRKNHALALNAWSTMLKTRDRSSIPYLVCVGAPGWMNESLYERLRRDEDLSERIVFLLNVSDQELNKLYDRAMFTIFPSMYEGWGLPISEALAHGKVPLVSNVSAHPEAGGAHAVYFELGSERDFQNKLEALIDDADSRRAREDTIKASTPLRPWSRISRDLTDFLAMQDTPVSVANAMPIKIVPGRYYVMSRNTERQILRLKHRAEQFRVGVKWEGIEEWGCWVRGGSGELRFALPDDGDAFQIYLHLSSPQSEKPAHDVTIAVPEAKWSMRTQTSSGAHFWRSFTLKLGPGQDRAVTLRLTGSPVVDFRLSSNGMTHARVDWR